MALKACEFISIVISAAVAGVFWGLWLGLSRSSNAFRPEIFIEVVHRIVQNLTTLMAILMPASLLSILPVLFLSYSERPSTFYLDVMALCLFIFGLLVTVIAVVPVTIEIDMWTASSLPDNWEQLRDRWKKFHVLRMMASSAGFLLLLIAAIF